MLLNSLKLKNIRSYTEETINFPEGSIILSGDIGTGKTTVLLSIEFALFGIIRGQLSGSSLLRHGKNKGYIELKFSLEKSVIIIRRGLKRSNKNVIQDAGYIIINGKKQDLSPTELKSKILELIGYQEELLTKSKSLIYRYTVYTPQEDMKQILLEKEDERLDVLRKVFNIDKYKRMKENTVKYVRNLKMLILKFETRLENLEEKKKEQDDYKETINRLDKEAKKEQILITEKKNELNTEKETLKQYEKKISSIEKAKTEIEIIKTKIGNDKQLLKNNKIDLEDINLRLSKSNKETEKTENVESLNRKNEELKKKKELLEQNIDKIKDRESKFGALKNNSESIIEKITSLESCPVCEQKVDTDYKKQIHKRENATIGDVASQISKLVSLKNKRIVELEELRVQINSLSERLKSQEIIFLKKKQFEEQKTKKINLLEKQRKLISKIKIEEQNLLVLVKKVEDKKLLLKYEKSKNLLEENTEKIKEKEIKQAELLREKKTLEGISSRLKEEIEKKEQSKLELIKVRDLQNWMLKYLLNIIYLMEKHILLRIHNEFNEYFQEWFNILLEDENLNVRLDETFTPIMEQNGYETALENLSGGEKTSVALAYRLALNKVINDFVGTIKTKDLLILDEPTDGFSSEQIDKIRDILDMLRIKQVVIVSHEPKLESYVDNIIRVHKEEHVSRVI